MKISKEFKAVFIMKFVDWLYTKFTKKKEEKKPEPPQPTKDVKVTKDTKVKKNGEGLWAEIKHFSQEEFDSPDLKGSGKRMSIILIRKLEQMREIIGAPILINSGYRTERYNKTLRNKGYKASKNSSHMKGLAVDIFTPTSESRFQIIDAAIGQGITRIGLSFNGKFVHLDIDPAKPQHVLWGY